MTNTHLEKKWQRLLFGFFCLSALYAVFSYSLTDPNLILTSWPPYWNFQQWIWQQLFHNSQLLTLVYSLLIGGFFLIYFWGINLTKQVKNKKKTFLKPKKLFLYYLLAISPLLISYNALSHDVFNYIFNAKMVWVYRADPHQQVALDFARDDWTRFMHNTHTPAPYGYGWTVMSLLPSILGFNRFLPTWLIFRAFSVLSLGLLFWVLKNLVKKANRESFNASHFWLVFANPLLLLEVVANQHNDLWMMVPAMTALLLIFQKPKKRALLRTTASGLLLAASITIKLATAALIPVWLIIVVSHYWTSLRKKLDLSMMFFISSGLMFFPLLTARSQQFLPWYLIWSLVWLPLIKQQWWKKWLIAFSITGLARYLPWLLAGGFNNQVLAQQKIILWGGGVAIWLVSLLWLFALKVRYNKTK